MEVTDARSSKLDGQRQPIEPSADPLDQHMICDREPSRGDGRPSTVDEQPDSPDGAAPFDEWLDREHRFISTPAWRTRRREHRQGRSEREQLDDRRPHFLRHAVAVVDDQQAVLRCKGEPARSEKVGVAVDTHPDRTREDGDHISILCTLHFNDDRHAVVRRGEFENEASLPHTGCTDDGHPPMLRHGLAR